MEAIDIYAKKMVHNLAAAFGGLSQFGPKVLGFAVAGNLNNNGWALIAQPEVCLQAAFAAWEEGGEWVSEEAREQAKLQAREGLVEGLEALGLSLAKAEEKWQVHLQWVAATQSQLQEEEAKEQEAGW